MLQESLAIGLQMPAVLVSTMSSLKPWRYGEASAQQQKLTRRAPYAPVRAGVFYSNVALTHWHEAGKPT